MSKRFRETVGVYSPLWLQIVGFGIVGLVIATPTIVDVLSTEKKTKDALSEETNKKIAVITEMELSSDDGYSILLKCMEKSGEKLQIRYSISNVDYIVLNKKADDTEKFKYLKEKIIPNYDPEIISEAIKHSNIESNPSFRDIYDCCKY